MDVATLMAPRPFLLFESPDCFLCKLPLNETLNFCTNCGVQVRLSHFVSHSFRFPANRRHPTYCCPFPPKISNAFTPSRQGPEAQSYLQR